MSESTTVSTVVSVAAAAAGGVVLAVPAMLHFLQQGGAACSEIQAELAALLKASAGTPCSVPSIMPLSAEEAGELSLEPLTAEMRAPVEAACSSVRAVLGTLAGRDLVISTADLPAFKAACTRLSVDRTVESAQRVVRSAMNSHQKTLRSASLDIAAKTLGQMLFTPVKIDRVRGRVIGRQGTGPGDPTLIVDVCERRNGEIGLAVDADIPRDQCGHAFQRLHHLLKANGMNAQMLARHQRPGITRSAATTNVATQ